MLLHLARPVDPLNPDGPARPACGALLERGAGLTDERDLTNCPQCQWIARPQPAFFLRVDGTAPLTPGHRTLIRRAYQRQLEETGEAELGLAVGDLMLPIAQPLAPSSTGLNLAGLRERARWLFLDRAYRVQGEDGALALALASASTRLDEPATIPDLLQRVYDEAVVLQAQPHTEEISGWVCDRQRDVGVKPYDEGYDPLTEEGKVPMRWYARHFILYFILQGNPDYEAGNGPALLAIAAEVIKGGAWQGATFSRSTMQALCRYIASVLPATASASRTWAKREAEIVGFHDPSAWEIVKGGVKAGVNEITTTAKEVVDAVEPPGGWGVGVLLGGVALGAFAIWSVVGKK